jgi:nucleotide-binding universal stress UspA family protein
MPHILLVPTDLSTAARQAAHRAAILAQHSGASMELLHVIETGALAQLRQLLDDKNDAVATRILALADDGLASPARDLLSGYGVTAGTHRAQGPLLPSITARAAEIGAELPVVGASSASHLRHWLLGATAERLLQKSTQPMLFVRQAPHEAYRNMLVSVDFSAGTSRTIAMAHGLNPQAQLILMHACNRWPPISDSTLPAGVRLSTTAIRCMTSCSSNSILTPTWSWLENTAPA